MSSPETLKPSTESSVVVAPPELLPTPDIQAPTTEAIHTDHHSSTADQLFFDAVEHGDPSMTGIRWRDEKNLIYRVSNYVPENNHLEQFGVNKGWYNTVTSKLQGGLDKSLPELPFLKVRSNLSPIFSGDQTFFKGVRKGVSGPYWDGHTTINRIQENSAYRTVDIFDPDGTLRHSIGFHNYQDFAAYIDRNVKPDKSAKGGHHEHEETPVIPAGFTGFEREISVPKAEPITDVIPLAGFPGETISIQDALAQKQRLGGLGELAKQRLGGLGGLTWTDERGRRQTIKYDTVRRVKDTSFGGDTNLEAVVCIETTYVTRPHEAGAGIHRSRKSVRSRNQEASPGGTEFKRQNLMSYDDLQKHFDDLGKRETATNAHWEIPEVAENDLRGKAQRQAELRDLQEDNRELSAAMLGRYVTGLVIKQPERNRTDLNDRDITLGEAIALLCEPDQRDRPGWEDRAQKTISDAGITPDALMLQQAVNEFGIKNVGEAADSLLKEYQSAMHRIGLHAVAEQASISPILVALARRHDEATKTPAGMRRSDHLTSGDPFMLTTEGFQARQEILDIQIARTFCDLALDPVIAPDRDNNGKKMTDDDHKVIQSFKGYLPRRDVVNLLPRAVADSVLELLSVGQPLESPAISDVTLIAVGDLLRKTWVDPYEKQLRLRQAQMKRERQDPNYSAHSPVLR